MLWPRRHRFWQLCPRRLFTGLAIIAYLITALGFPLPAGAAKDVSEPYPCMDHPCGCLSAEQCWRHCCCFTPEQKFAWAEAHGVVPPAYAERPEGPTCRADGSLHETEDSATGSRGCATCARRPSAGGQQAHCSCSAHQHCRRPEPADPTPARTLPKPTTGPNWVLGFAALGCRGSLAAWATAGAALPPPLPVAWHPTWPPAGGLRFTFPCQPLHIQHPLDPPPRPALS